MEEIQQSAEKAQNRIIRIILQYNIQSETYAANVVVYINKTEAIKSIYFDF